MLSESDSEKRLTGLAISPGLAVGRVCLFRQDRHNELPPDQLSDKGPARERDRLRQAIDTVADRLDGLRETVAERIGPAEAEIFVAQKMIIRDPVLVDEMDRFLEEGLEAEAAVLRTLEQYESKLLEVDDAYLKERASDLGELKRRLLDVLRDTRPAFLCAIETRCQQGKDRVVITEELTPSVALELETDRILGFVTERGGPTSHAAIVARALGIPAVSGIANIHRLVPCGTEVLIDGEAGEVIVRPGPKAKARVGRAGVTRPSAPVAPVESFRVMANISVAAEVDEAAAMMAEGVGLYRTEFEFFTADRLLDEDEQFRLYSRVVGAMAGRPVHIRLLDVGADKVSGVFDMPEERNPALGCRGARFLLARPQLLRPQARALVRASRIGPVRVMYPMIVGVAQFRQLRQLFDEATSDLPAGDIQHGVMFETPSACLEAEELLRAAEFGSIGSNDLVQYLFAADRDNERVARDYDPDRGVLWGVLEKLASAAAKARRELSICGELAADPEYTARLLSVGIRSVSVSSLHIPRVRRRAAEAMKERNRP